MRLAEILEPLANSGAILVTLNSTGRVLEAVSWSGGTSDLYSDAFASTIAPTAAPIGTVDSSSGGSNTFLTVNVEEDWWILALLALAIIVSCLLCAWICLCCRDRDTRDMIVKDQRLDLATRPHAGPIQPNDFDLTSDYLMAASRAARSPGAGSNYGHPGSRVSSQHELQSPYLDITDSPPKRSSHYFPAGLENFPWSPEGPQQPRAPRNTMLSQAMPDTGRQSQAVYHPASLQNPAFATDNVSRISGYNQAWHNVAASPDRHYYPTIRSPSAQGVPTRAAWAARSPLPIHREVPEYADQMALSPHGAGGVRWDGGWHEDGNTLQEADYNAYVSPRR